MNQWLPWAFSAVFPMLLRTSGDKAEILLHRRQNTGYQDGKWDVAGSGRVDEGETARAAAVRECREELGIAVEMEELTFVHLSHRLSKNTSYAMYFLVTKYVGAPSVMEPEKCSELKWFGIDDLPPDMIECRAMAVQAYKNKETYSEIVERL